MEQKQRTSLTKAQLNSSVGLELLSICQSVTSDGKLADEEIKALHNWINSNTAHDLPAIRFLAATIGRVLEDGIITPEERETVAKAIEAVLPTEERKYAAALRRQVTQEERKRLKTAADAAKQEQREIKERNRPIGDADFMVAGSRHDGRSAVITKEVRPGGAAFLKREPRNSHSRNAIAVLTETGRTIGYVPEDWALDIAPLLDEEALHSAVFKKILDYDTGPVPVVVARFYESGATVPGALRQDQQPSGRQIKALPSSRKSQRKYSTGNNNKLWIVVFAILTFVLIAASLQK